MGNKYDPKSPQDRERVPNVSRRSIKKQQIKVEQASISHFTHFLLLLLNIWLFSFHGIL